MLQRRKIGQSLHAELQKSPSGIQGLDEITDGGLPKGRVSLVVGKAGSGKTLLGMEFLLRGALEYHEPGVFISFEETERDLVQNFASLGYDLTALMEKNQIAIDHMDVTRNDIIETGEFDLEGLFIRLNHAIDSIGAKRVVLDTIESLFSGLTNAGILRAELRRLFFWLKEKGVTAIVTGESGEGALTRHGLEEYISDCVIVLDHRVEDQISTRRLRVVKYRGSTHGTNEYPFLIDEGGISVLPITSVGLAYTVTKDRVSSGIERLDTMLEGRGFYRGSTILLAGTPGTGKTSFAAAFADAACRRGERCLFFSFEESPDQIIRNVQSIGIDLTPHLESGLLRIHSSRPTLFGLEMHLVLMLKEIREVRPQAVIVDPLSDLICRFHEGRQDDARTPGRLPEDAADHRVLHAPDPHPRSAAAERSRRLLHHRHPDPSPVHRVRGGAQPRDVHPEVAGDGPLEPDPGVPDHGRRHRHRGYLPRRPGRNSPGPRPPRAGCAEGEDRDPGAGVDGDANRPPRGGRATADPAGSAHRLDREDRCRR